MQIEHEEYEIQIKKWKFQIIIFLLLVNEVHSSKVLIVAQTYNFSPFQFLLMFAAYEPHKAPMSHWKVNIPIS